MSDSGEEFRQLNSRMSKKRNKKLQKIQNEFSKQTSQGINVSQSTLTQVNQVSKPISGKKKKKGRQGSEMASTQTCCGGGSDSKCEIF